VNRRFFLRSIAALATLPAAALSLWKPRYPTVGAINQATYTFWRSQQFSQTNWKDARLDIYSDGSFGPRA
jgi:hypothetical protein